MLPHSPHRGACHLFLPSTFKPIKKTEDNGAHPPHGFVLNGMGMAARHCVLEYADEDDRDSIQVRVCALAMNGDDYITDTLILYSSQESVI